MRSRSVSNLIYSIKSATKSIIEKKNKILQSKETQEWISTSLDEHKGDVDLSEDEFQKLKSKFGNSAEEYIEKLSSYVASSGKKYKSHYATILNWAQKDNQSSGGSNYEPKPRKLCTEYPE